MTGSNFPLNTQRKGLLSVDANVVCNKEKYTVYIRCISVPCDTLSVTGLGLGTIQW